MSPKPAAAAIYDSKGAVPCNAPIYRQNADIHPGVAAKAIGNRLQGSVHLIRPRGRSGAGDCVAFLAMRTH